MESSAANAVRHALSRRTLLKAGALSMALPVVSSCAGAGGSSSGGGNITFLADTRDEWPRLEKLMPQLEEKYGFGFSIQHLQETPLRAKAGLELTAESTSIDVLMMDFMLLPQYAEGGRLEPLDAYLEASGTFRREDFRAPFLDALTVDGNLYGVPITQDCNLLIYRADIFEELGLDVPDTMEELAEVAAELADWGRADGISGIAMRGQRGVGISEWTWPCFLNSFGGSYYRNYPEDRTPALDSDEAIEALEFYVDLLATAGPAGAASYGPTEVLNDLMAGKTAMVIDSATLGTSAENPEKSTVAGKLGYAMVPQGPAGRHPGFYTWAISVPKGSSRAADGGAFAAWMVSPEVAVEVGFSAPNQALENTYNFPKYEGYAQAQSCLEALMASLEIADPDYRPRNAQAQEIGDIVSKAISEAVSGQVSPAAALREANEAAAAVVAES